MNSEPLRIVSLLPSATEIIASLGLVDALVGRSHECDFPQGVEQLPICTQPKMNPEGSSGEIHDRVTDLLKSALSVYQIKTDVLEQLNPTHIITQAQCDVCACTLQDVEEAVSKSLSIQPQIISLQPNLLADVWGDIERVAGTLKVDSQPVIEKLKSRVEAVSSLVKGHSPTVACIEWTEPLMAAGNWIPELVSLAGGESVFGVAGKHSPWLKWEELAAADPEVIIFMPCGFDLERTRQDAMPLIKNPEWQNLQAIKTGKVYITDGNAYFNRPGPRLVDSLEILAEILHPDIFNFGYRGAGWEFFTS
ncbi:cobalamin-binding protein [Microcoleus sp. FACHB-672]|uniref:cobalamin-binding protein n=1 Tax=Microcoleus sp. FACHB-672 TaxID=2692825 RepID=UPI001689E119|nr:cobalamin-binding protein [Microcoleus sp. FACHB-672]MBD2041899.1 cobalamin-binding protein [Microcoleus sp. FACHB-672]